LSKPRTTAGRGSSGQPNPAGGAADAFAPPQLTAIITTPGRNLDNQRMRPTLAATDGHGKIGLGVCGQLASM
jgi:hypothetical protein